jgi:Rieske Fe-S protein
MCEGPHEEPPNPSRRRLLKVGLIAGGAAGATIAIGSQLLKSPSPELEVRDEIMYPPSPAGAWWDAHAGQPMRATDFAEWQGAPGLWRATYDRGTHVSGSGTSVVAVRVRRDDTVFTAPTDVSLPAGVSLFHDDPARDLRIVVLASRCAHLCCKVTWHDATIHPGARDYLSNTPTWELFGQDPIYCQCHSSQYDPMVLVRGTHPGGTTEYVGAQRVHGPATRPIPVVPLRVDSDTLVGVMVDSRWYEYCR